mmetsp:Transcript_6849/g.28600  ORF Transcript_6849/g.28600 Transcript_6849/m.28600 type:complete len:281 (+) Transcript_6849:315-1157(+)
MPRRLGVRASRLPRRDGAARGVDAPRRRSQAEPLVRLYRVSPTFYGAAQAGDGAPPVAVPARRPVGCCRHSCGKRGSGVASRGCFFVARRAGGVGGGAAACGRDRRCRDARRQGATRRHRRRPVGLRRTPRTADRARRHAGQRRPGGRGARHSYHTKTQDRALRRSRRARQLLAGHGLRSGPARALRRGAPVRGRRGRPTQSPRRARLGRCALDDALVRATALRRGPQNRGERHVGARARGADARPGRASREHALDATRHRPHRESVAELRLPRQHHRWR